jgi:hypothetical protein
VTHFVISHEFEADPERYWPMFFDDAYNAALYDRLKVKERKVIEWREDETTIYRSIRVLPERDLPGFMKKLLGGDLGYTEISTYKKGTNHIDTVVETTLLKDKIDMKILYDLIPLAPGRLQRKIEGDIKVSVPLVGGKIESVVINDMKRSYDVAAQLTGEWLKKGGA